MSSDELSDARARGAAPTIYDVARVAEVSFKTVSRVMNHDHRVKPSTRARVQQVISTLGFRPNTAARKLAGCRSFTLALLIGETAPSWLMRSQLGMVKACREAGYQLLLEYVPADMKANRIVRLVYGLGVEGIIVASPLDGADDIAAALAAASIACVFVDAVPRPRNGGSETLCAVAGDVDDHKAFCNGSALVDQVIYQLILREAEGKPSTGQEARGKTPDE